MALQTAVWLVNGEKLVAQERVVLDSERRLEEWLAHDLSLLGENLLLLGRQVRTTGGPLDILAIDGEGDVVIAELKKNRTPRDVVAQVLDYASWVSELSPHDVDEICRKQHGRALTEAFRNHFEYDLPETACKSHRTLVVAAELDDSSERIIRYLQEQFDIDINAVFFSVYRIGSEEILARAWLADPAETHERAERREKVPWSGVWFVNNGIDENPENYRDWELCIKYGFISAGGDEKYSRPLLKLSVGDTIAAYQKRSGYVGVGTVWKEAMPVNEFELQDGTRLRDVTQLKGTREDSNAEYAVGVDWIKTVPASEAKTFRGVFANQNVVCKLRHGPTLELLREHFGLDVSARQSAATTKSTTESHK